MNIYRVNDHEGNYIGIYDNLETATDVAKAIGGVVVEDEIKVIRRVVKQDFRKNMNDKFNIELDLSLGINYTETGPSEDVVINSVYVKLHESVDEDIKWNKALLEIEEVFERIFNWEDVKLSCRGVNFYSSNVTKKK